MDYECREKSLGSVHSMLQLDEPCMAERTASALTVLTAAAMEGTAPNTHNIDITLTKLGYVV